MTETLFERYKEALRAGHVAVMRGRFEDAAAAYREAIAIAGDRAVPRTALGGVCLRLGDPEGALAAYEEALALDADDDGALLGRAQALVVLRRTTEAAATYDRLTDARERAGRGADATEAARRALAIEPTDERRARHAALAAAARGADVAVAAEGGEADAAEAATDGAEGGERALEPAAGPAEAPAASPEEPAAPEAPAPDPEALVAAAEDAASRGDAGTAAAAALAAARAYRDAGQPAAAFDACLVGIGARPADVDLHLLLAELADDRGASSQASGIYRNLLRLAALDGDTIGEERIRAAATAAGAEEGPAVT